MAGYRSLQLTPEGLRFVLLSIGVGVAAINTGNNLLYLLFAMMLSLIVISGILSEYCLRHVHITRHRPRYLFAGQPAPATYRITNRSAHFPVFSLRLVDRIDGGPADGAACLQYVGPGETVTVPYAITPRRRGRFRFDGATVSTRFPFTLFDKAVTIPLKDDLLVYPAITALPPSALEHVRAVGHDTPRPMRGQGTTLYNLRLYQPGDDSRTIHWRTTAKRSQLIVRETEADDHRRVTIRLGTVPSAILPADGMEQFERAVSLAASLAIHFLDRQYEVRVIVGETDVPAETGDAHRHRVLALLAVCAPQFTPASSPSSHTDTSPHDALTIVIEPWPVAGMTLLEHGAVHRLADAEGVR